MLSGPRLRLASLVSDTTSCDAMRVSVQHISAHMNPAYCLGLWLIGDLDAADFFALSAAELGGAMIGALVQSFRT